MSSTTYVTTSHKKPEKPDTLPRGMRPAPPGSDLGIKGMRVILTRKTEPVGTVRHSHDDPVLGPRAYVVLDNGCSAWVPIDDVEPYDGPEPTDETGTEATDEHHDRVPKDRGRPHDGGSDGEEVQ